MPKMKTKSAAKKRFKVTGTGKVMFARAGKRHNLRKRTQKMKRKARNSPTMLKGDARKVIRFFLPGSV